MIQDLFQGFQIVHGILVLLVAIAFFRFWARTRFWFPRYVHYLAALALLVGMILLSIMPEDAPINEKGPLAKVLLAAAFPALVYFFFIFYGGQQAAFESQLGTEIEACPYCGEPLSVVGRRDTAGPARSTSVENQCPRCCQTLA